jgi:hypothetical protein
VLVWIVIRHFPRGFLTHGALYDLSNPVERENALNSVFPLDNLNSKRKGIHILSLSKKAFLTSGTVVLSEASGVETLITQLQRSLARLYSALDLAQVLDNDCTRIKSKGGSIVPGSAALAFVASTTRHSFSDLNGFKNHINPILEDARSLQASCADSNDEELKIDAENISDAIQGLETAISLVDGPRFPSYELFHREFTRAVGLQKTK